MTGRMTAGQVGRGNWWTEGIPSIQDQLVAGDAAEDIADDMIIHAEAEHIELENSRAEIVEWVEGLRPDSLSDDTWDA